MRETSPGDRFDLSSATDGGLPSSEATPPALPGPRSIGALLPIMGVVLVAFLVIGMALPVLPLHVHRGLGLSAFVVGLVAGSQFAASLISRVWAGRYSDRCGAKRAVITGLASAVVAGLLYLLSLPFAVSPWISVSILLAGRALLGGAESLIITGAVSWGLSLAGPENAGRVIAWVGMAMFAALALGAPIGAALFEAGGFVTIAAATALLRWRRCCSLHASRQRHRQKVSAPALRRWRARSGYPARLGAEQHRLWCDARLQLPPFRRARMEPDVAARSAHSPSRWWSPA